MRGCVFSFLCYNISISIVFYQLGVSPRLLTMMRYQCVFITMSFVSGYLNERRPFLMGAIDIRIGACGPCSFNQQLAFSRAIDANGLTIRKVETLTMIHH